ncbi:MAG: TRAP transporter large permease subunit [Gammaproteobacteria bacterium]
MGAGHAADYSWWYLRWFFTPTEAAAVSVVYALLIETLVYRDLSLSKLVAIVERGAIATAVIFVLLAFGGALSDFITLAQVPNAISGYLAAIEAGPSISAGR